MTPFATEAGSSGGPRAAWRPRLGILLLGVALGAALADGPALLRQVGRLGLIGQALAQDQAASDPDDLLPQITLFAKVAAQVSGAYVKNVSPKLLVRNALRGMLEGLDAHSGYLSARELHAVDGYAADKLVGIGVELAANPGGATIVSTMPGSPARLAGFAAGDMITAINTSPVAGAGLMQIIQRLGGKPGTDVAVTLRRAADGATVERTLQRTALQGETVEHRLMGDVGYLKILSFADDTETGLRRAYAALLAEGGDKLRGLVIDLRNNPGGLVDQAVAVCNDFLVSGLVVSMRPRHAEDTVKIEAHGNDITGGRPLVVLINEATASAAEIVAAALQDHRRAIVLGVRSFGKGSVQTITPLDDDAGAIRLTTALYYTPSGRSIQARGITPDVEVRSEFASGKVVREADLPDSLRTADADRPAEPRADLPAAIAAIPRVPPDAWPVSPTHSLEQDFQAQQAILLLRLVTGGLPQAATGSLIHVTTEAGSAR